MSKLPALTPDDPLRVVARPSPVNTIAGPNAPMAAPDDLASEKASGAATEAVMRATDRDPANARHNARPDPLTVAMTAPAPVPPSRRRTGSLPTAAAGVELSGATDVITHRAPSELLKALQRRVHQLQLPKGMTVAVAIEQLLELNDSELIELVESMEQRFENGRRRARRAA